MPSLFESRRTEAGRAAIHDLINHITDHRSQIMTTWRGHSIDLNNWRWMAAFVHFLMGEHETALSLANRYLSESQEIPGDNAQAIANGHYLLMIINATSGRAKEERAAVFQEGYSIRGRYFVDMRSQMTVTLYALAVAYHRQDDPKSAQRAFLTALLALFLSSLAPEPTPTDLAKRLSHLFQSLGFLPNLCGWLIRRSCYVFTDFIGLVSVLIDEGLFPSGATESDELSTVEADEEMLATEYEIVVMEDSDWKLPEGFSKEFPASVADGELSMRVEELLHEGCRCLETTGDLTNVWLVFTSRSSGRLITVFGADTWSEANSDKMDETLGRIVAENGADSFMILACIDLRRDELSRSLKFLRNADDDKAITVIARDAKGAVAGLQPANLIEGKYVFGEPVLSDAGEESLVEFNFPVQPAVKTSPQKPTDESDLAQE